MTNTETDETDEDFLSFLRRARPGSLTTVVDIMECGVDYSGPAVNVQWLTLSCGHRVYFHGHARQGENIPCVTCLSQPLPI